MPAFLLRLLADLLTPPAPEVLLARAVTAEKLMARVAPPLREDGVLVCLSFDDPIVRGVVHALKYHGSRDASTLLARVAYEVLCEALAEKRMFESFARPLLVPLPLHERRLRERGFNQTERVAKILMQHLLDTCVYAPAMLMRVRHTKSQTHLGPRERRENVRGAFAVPEHLRASMKNREVILLDDVVTTGSTLQDARRALLEGGAREVLCVALAGAGEYKS